MGEELHHGLKAGSIWDEKLKCWMALKDLLVHPDALVREVWHKSSCKEFGSQFQGHESKPGKDVLKFIKRSDVPPGAKVTYPRTTVA